MGRMRTLQQPLLKDHRQPNGKGDAREEALKDVFPPQLVPFLIVHDDRVGNHVLGILLIWSGLELIWMVSTHCVEIAMK